MFSNFQVGKRGILTAGGLIGLIGLISFTEVKHRQRYCERVIVRLDDVDGHSFLTTRDVTGYLTNQGADPVIGKSFDEIDFRQLEKRLSNFGLVMTCEVSRDLPGNLIVSVKQPRPVARLVSAGEGLRAASGQYISEEGRIFSLSMNYSARVLLVSGAYFSGPRMAGRRSLPANDPLMDLFRFVQQDPFWRAQLTEMNVDKDGYVTIWPQVGHHSIEFGPPTDIDIKFKKLKLLYSTILPAEGWEQYSRISVQYRNQLVCELRQ